MSRFRVNLTEPSKDLAATVPYKDDLAATAPFNEDSAANSAFAEQSVIESLPSAVPKKKSALGRFLRVAGVALLVAAFLGAIGGYLYWRSVKQTPQYSLALLVDAARRDDKAQIERLIDTEAVIDDFMPQVTSKAIELYGRNLPPQALAKVEQVAAPAIPVIKERAKTELPQVIRDKTAPVEKVPYWMIALFASRAVDISIEKDTALVKSKLPDRPLELTMKRENVNGGEAVWKVTAMKDDVLARKIAEKIGQDIIAAAAKNGIKKAVQQLGVKDLEQLNDIDIFK